MMKYGLKDRYCRTNEDCRIVHKSYKKRARLEDVIANIRRRTDCINLEYDQVQDRTHQIQGKRNLIFREVF
jgi:hypothetical protein